MVPHIGSAAEFVGDGGRQQFPFVGVNGNPIMVLDKDRLRVQVDGEETDGFSTTVDGDDMVLVTMFTPPANGSIVLIERNTPPHQPRDLQAEWGPKVVEEMLDHVTCALQDCLYGLSKIERRVEVEHRTVDVATSAPQISDIEGLKDHLSGFAEQRSVDDMARRLDTVIADIAEETSRIIVESRSPAETQIANMSKRVDQLEAAIQRLRMDL